MSADVGLGVAATRRERLDGGVAVRAFEARGASFSPGTPVPVELLVAEPEVFDSIFCNIVASQKKTITSLHQTGNIKL